MAASWQQGAIGAMVALGITFFIASYSAYLNLDGSYSSSYTKLLFEDFGIKFHSAPERVAERIARIPGVSAVEARLVEDVGITIPGRNGGRKLVGRLIGIPSDRALLVNRLRLVKGRMLKEATRREILLEASFAQYHKLAPGDYLTVSRSSSEVRLQIAGIVQSPEYLYVVRSKHELMAMPDTFGVMFVSSEILGPLIGQNGQVNEVRARVTQQNSIAFAMKQANAILNTYQPEKAVSRVDQASYQMLRQDVEGFQAYATLFPMFFLGVASLSVYTLLMRSVHQQRPVIGLLKSLGHSSSTVISHYLAGSLLVGFAGSLVGALIGIWVARWISLAYMSQLQVPYKEIFTRWPVVIWGIVIGSATCGFAALLPARIASRIQPAEAMRPVTPSFGRSSLQPDRLIPNAKLLWRIPLRNLFRQPRRTLSTLFGIVSGMALIMTARGLLDSSEYAIDQLVSGTYQYDLRMDFIRPQPGNVLNRVQSWPGVVLAEGVLELPVEMTHEGVTYSSMISGQTEGSRLHSIEDRLGRILAVPSEGAIFGPTLQKRLSIEPGSLVKVSLPEQMTAEASSQRDVRVVAINKEAMGTVAYMARPRLLAMFRRDLELPPNAISGIVVRVPLRSIKEIRKRLQDLPEAGSVLSVPEISALIYSMLKTIRYFVWIMELFGVALASAMIFNMVTINVLERTAEVATLRTLGVSKRQIGVMVATENVLVAVIGIILGLPLGRLFIDQFWKAAQTPEQEDLFTFDVFLKPETYATAAVAVLIIAILSLYPALRLLGQLNLARATKDRAAS